MSDSSEIDLLVDATLKQIIAEGAPGPAGLSEKLCAVIRKCLTHACLDLKARTACAQRQALEQFLHNT